MKLLLVSDLHYAGFMTNSKKSVEALPSLSEEAIFQNIYVLHPQI